jgi:hypothetical protein
VRNALISLQYLTVRLLPPGFAGRINGAINAQWVAQSAAVIAFVVAGVRISAGTGPPLLNRTDTRGLTTSGLTGRAADTYCRVKLKDQV